MQFSCDEHFCEIVIPAWQAHRASERSLTEAVLSKDEVSVKRARYAALREGGAACFYIHHFSEIVLHERPSWLPCNIGESNDVIEWLTDYCTGLRSDNHTDDIRLLRDITDALKHSVLTHRVAERQVLSREAVLVVSTGYGRGRYGEGKYGGMQQVIIQTKSGRRVLSSVLQNVIDAWRRAINLPLPPIGQP